MSSSYHFLPWVRTGAGSAVTAPDPLNDTLVARAEFPVRFAVNGQPTDGVDLTMQGPGDITGLDHRQVVRSDPSPGATSFEPDYFPSVEFDRADLPWLFTPAAADARGRLRPWLCLIVVRQQTGVSIAFPGGGALPVLSISSPADPAGELPDLAESWAWAHAQVVTVPDASDVAGHLEADTVQTVSRLICPRRLQPGVGYHACVVPTFGAGVRSGLDEILDREPATLDPAWDLRNPPSALRLPVYHRWEFRTGPAGDFESLAERLQGRTVPAGVGYIEVDATNPGFGLPGAGKLSLGGALVPADPAPAQAPAADFVAEMQQVLNLPASLADDPAGPVVGPPIYGGRQASANRVRAEPRWLRDLNIDPRLRSVAGLGADVIRERQEQLMAAAWDQQAENSVRSRRARFGRVVRSRVHERRFATRTAQQLLLLTAPSHARVRAATGSSTTLLASLKKSLPEQLTSTTFRKVTRPNRHILRTVNRSTVRAGFSNLLSTADAFVGGLVIFPAPRPAADTIADNTLRDRADEMTTRVETTRFATSAQREQAERLRNATSELAGYFDDAIDRAPPKVRPGIDFTQLGEGLIAHFDTSTRFTIGQLHLGGEPRPGALASRAGVVAAQVPDVTTGPEFTQPMYETLREQAPDFLLPGAEGIPNDTVTLLATNKPFVESFMVGLNHEMGSELMWREFPSNQRHTTFRNFWQPVDAAAAAAGQMRPIHRWEPTADLGDNLIGPAAAGGLVLLIRGELLLRYPNTFVYATRADSRTKPGADRRLPVFVGRLDPDMVFVGFDLTVEEARGTDGGQGWFFVLEQPASEARFGLDPVTEFGRPTQNIGSDLAWSDVVAGPAELAGLSHAPLTGRLDGVSLGPAQWGMNSGHQAAATLQRPFSFFVHADDMLSGES